MYCIVVNSLFSKSWHVQGEHFSRYELPLVRLSSFAGLAAHLVQTRQVVITALADGIYYTDRSVARLCCCLCDGATDLRELLARTSLSADTASAMPMHVSSSAIEALLQGTTVSLHQAGCPVSRTQPPTTQTEQVAVAASRTMLYACLSLSRVRVCPG